MSEKVPGLQDIQCCLGRTVTRLPQAMDGSSPTEHSIQSIQVSVDPCEKLIWLDEHLEFVLQAVSLSTEQWEITAALGEHDVHGLHLYLLGWSEYVKPGLQGAQDKSISLYTTVPQGFESSVPAGHIGQSVHVISVRFNESSWFNWIWSYPHFAEDILPHIVSKCLVHLAISLCLGPQGEHRLHCSLSVREENVSPSAH